MLDTCDLVLLGTRAKHEKTRRQPARWKIQRGAAYLRQKGGENLMGLSERMDAALQRLAANEPAKKNDAFLLEKVKKEGSQRGRNYRAYLKENRKSPR